ncbi:MAG: efflux RND transporter periplasmic adaptor subunit [Woeseiaceae bacterium]
MEKQIELDFRLVLRSVMSVFVLGILAACAADEPDEAREPGVRPVKMLSLSPAGELQTSRYPGVIEAIQFAELSFPVGGRVAEIAVASGHMIGAGDVIATLDQRDFQSRVTAAQAAFRNAEEQFQRAARLAAEDAIAANVLEQREQQRDVARAELDVAEKALEESILRAPFSGYIAQIAVRSNTVVSAGQMVASLTGQQGAEVKIDVSASVMARWQAVENAEAHVVVDAWGDVPMKATFRSANLIADSVSQTYAVKFGFEREGDLIALPGMPATVVLTAPQDTATSSTRISVPLTAVLSDGVDKYVWVVDDETMTVLKREVTVAEGVGESIIVTEGLEGHETIAIAGASFLGDGMQVRPWSE